jgi:hypothetical protein
MFADVTEEKSGYGGRMKSPAPSASSFDAQGKQGEQEWLCTEPR